MNLASYLNSIEMHIRIRAAIIPNLTSTLGERYAGSTIALERSKEMKNKDLTRKRPNYSRWMYIALIAFILFSGVNTIFAQPELIRYVNDQRWSFQDCMARAKWSLETEGYVINWAGGDAYRARKAPYAVLILCNPTPEGLTRVNVIISAAGGSVETENTRLWNRLGNPSTGGTGGTGGAEEIDWTRQADPWRGNNGRRYSLRCKARGTISSRVWGTDVYTDDSSICSAAVHAGLVTTSSGGTVTIEIRPGQNSYTASTRNGITSQRYDAWNGSFVFVR